MTRATGPTVPSHVTGPTLPAAYLRLALEAVAGGDASRRTRLLVAAGLRAGADSQWGPVLPYDDALQMLGRIGASQPSGWHLALAPRLDAAIHGPLGFAALTAPALSDALNVLLTYSDIRAPFVWFSRRREGLSCVIQCHGSGDLKALHQPLMELSLLAVLMLVKQVTGRDARELRARMPGEPPPHADALRQLAGAPLDFGASGFIVEMPVAWLALPSLLADEGMHRISLARCRDLLDAIANRSELAVGLRQDLMKAGGVSPGLAAVAATRHMSPRTLIRRLKRSGTSYQQILDEVRGVIAADLLRNTDLPIAEITARLGYADPANFGRAFRAWHGMPPGRFRDG